MKEHTLSYCSLDCSKKLSKITFPDSQLNDLMTNRRDLLITDELTSPRAELLL